MIFIYNQNIYISSFKYKNKTTISENQSEYLLPNSINFTNSNNISVNFPYLQPDPILEIEFPDFPEE